MLRTSVTVFALVIMAAAAVVAGPGQPSFAPEVYADGQAWGTKGTTPLPAPNEHNLQSFDKLFVVTNSNNPDGQLPVGEAAPGNPDYNGGRWYTHTVTWTPEGFVAHGGTVPVLKSTEDIEFHAGLGHIMVLPGSPGGPGSPPMFFQCPLLPVK